MARLSCAWSKLSQFIQSRCFQRLFADRVFEEEDWYTCLWLKDRSLANDPLDALKIRITL
jgi:hypothetical protein